MPPKRHNTVRLAVIYFCLFGGLGSFFPYLPLILASRGFTASQIGRLLMLIPVAMVFAPTLWGRLADARGARERFLALSAFGSSAGVVAVLGAHSLTAAFAAIALFAVMRSPQSTLADALAHSILGADANGFGRIRVWGSVGFALAAWTVGQLKGGTHATVAVAFAGSLYAIAAVVSWRHANIENLANIDAGSAPAAALRPWRHLRERPMLLTIAATACHYSAQSTYDAFFGLHLVALGYDEALLGAAWTFGVAVEIVVMLYAPRFIRPERSGPILVLCGLAAALRWGAVSQVSGEAALVLWQGLHGFTFGLWYLALVNRVQSRAPERLRATVQSAIAGAVGLGATFGLVGGGELFEAAGGHVLYAAACVMALAGAGIYALAGSSTQRSPQKSHYPR